MGAALLAHGAHGLGAAADWPQALRTAAGIVLHAGQPMCVLWGSELRLLFNDACRFLPGASEPGDLLGQPCALAWPALLEEAGALLKQAMRGAAAAPADIVFPAPGDGARRIHATLSASPIHDASGAVGGVLCVCTPAAPQAARLRVLDAIGEATRVASDPEVIMEASTRQLGEYLGATRVAYADVEPDNDRFTIRNDWRVAGAISTVGVYSLDLFGSRATSNLRVGRLLVIDDVDRELAEGDGYEMFSRIDIKAIICCPLVKGGKLVAMMAVHQQRPRAWTADEIALIEDVVERCWAHIERVRAMEALRMADRHKSEFLATLAHELRNPLAPIRNGLDILRVSDGKPALQASVRDVMDRQLRHMTHLVNDLLDIARVASGKIVLQRETVDLRDVVAAAVESSMPLVEAARHRLDVVLPDASLDIDADPVRMAQVIGNLLTNAAKYTPPGGRIVLQAGMEDGAVAIAVADDGIGIAPESLGAVFEMFTQVAKHIDRANGGLGIGLSLVRRLVELHGGTVRADSPGPGRGSTFSIRLPAARTDGTAAGARPPPAVVPASWRALRVLVADDNADAVRILAALLELEGHEVRSAGDGVEALEVAAAFRPELAFLDIGMPRMDGYEAARRLRAIPGLERIRLAALTGWGAPEDRARSRAAGFDHHLLKPAAAGDIRALLAAAAGAQDDQVR